MNPVDIGRRKIRGYFRSLDVLAVNKGFPLEIEMQKIDTLKQEKKHYCAENQNLPCSIKVPFPFPEANKHDSSKNQKQKQIACGYSNFQQSKYRLIVKTIGEKEDSREL